MTRHRQGTFGRRLRPAGALVAVGVMLAVAACSSSNGSSTGSTSTPSSGSSATSSPLGSAAPADDIGITSTTIRVAIIADVNAPANPGLFQKSLNAVEAWADIVNASGGLAGRKVVVDAMDSKEDPSVSLNDVIQACSQDFALVGTEALALSDMSPVDTCKNAQGQAIGIPDLAGIAFGALQECDPDTFAVLGDDPAYCATEKDSQPYHTEQIGDAKWLASQYPGLTGLWLYDTDLPTAQATQVPTYEGEIEQGIKKDGQGFYGDSGEAPQSSLTPFVTAVKRYGATYVNDGVTPPNMVLLRREAQLQGVSSVKVWECSAGCYAEYFLQEGGSAVNGTYQTMQTIPFFTEYKSVPELATLINKLGGVANLDSNALASYIEALLFQDAVEKVVASGQTLTRASLFNVLRTDETSFDADGIVGPTNVSKHEESPCFDMVQVQNDTWQRVYPAKPGSFDCSSSNLIEVAQPSS